MWIEKITFTWVITIQNKTFYKKYIMRMNEKI